MNCKTNASGCYDQFKAYLGTSQGAKELAQVGRTLYASAALALELQQSTCRIRACQYAAGDTGDAAAAKGACAAAFDYVAKLKVRATQRNDAHDDRCASTKELPLVTTACSVYC